MCDFLSGIGLKTGGLLTSLITESHEDLISMYHLRDVENTSFVRLEYVPKHKKGEILDYSGEYYLKNIAGGTPAWVTPKLKKQWILAFEKVKTQKIIKTDTDLIIGKSCVLLGPIAVNRVRFCSIKYAGDANILYVQRSEINNAGHCFIYSANHVKISDGDTATIENATNVYINKGNNMKIVNGDHISVGYQENLEIKNANYISIYRDCE